MLHYLLACGRGGSNNYQGRVSYDNYKDLYLRESHLIKTVAPRLLQTMAANRNRQTSLQLYVLPTMSRPRQPPTGGKFATPITQNVRSARLQRYERKRRGKREKELVARAR